MKKFIRFICFLLVLLTVLITASDLLTVSDRKDIMHIKGFFCEPENSLDVTLIGASELYTGFNSPLAWKKYGFTSYSFCYAGMVGSHYKLAVDEVLSRQKPKLMVIEINGFLYDQEYMEDMTKAHTFLDNLPKDKIRRDFIKENYDFKTQMEFFFPIIKHHDNWKHPKSCLACFKSNYSIKKNGIVYSKAFSSNYYSKEVKGMENFKPIFCDYSRDCMIDLLEHLNELGVENVLFARFPHTVKNSNIDVYHEIEGLVTAYGYDFVNFENEFKQFNLDINKDFYNRDHMNVFGMKKFTDGFSKYILDNYDVISQHTAEVTEMWNLCYEKTERLIKKVETTEPDQDMKAFYEIHAYDM